RGLRDLVLLHLSRREFLRRLGALLFLHLSGREFLRRRLCGRVLLSARRDRSLHLLLLVVLLHNGLAWLIAVLPALKHLLLLQYRVSVARILALVNRQRGGGRNGIAVPLVPARSLLRPRGAPVLVPARRC